MELPQPAASPQPLHLPLRPQQSEHLPKAHHHPQLLDQSDLLVKQEADPAAQPGGYSDSAGDRRPVQSPEPALHRPLSALPVRLALPVCLLVLPVVVRH